MSSVHDAPYKILLDCLRSARRSANLTQVALARALGTDQTYISKYERGERRLDVVEVRDICKALQIEFVSFIAAFEQQLRKKGVS